MDKKSQTIKRSVYYFKIIALGVILGVSIQFAEAWTNPSAPAPAGNLAGPINTGVGAQVKQGALTSAVSLGAPMLCIGTDCRTAWPDASGGGPIATTVQSCVNNTCTGNVNTMFFPVRNANNRRNAMPQLCSGNSFINANGGYWQGFTGNYGEGACSGGSWMVASNCQNPVTFGTFQNCPDTAPVPRTNATCVRDVYYGENSVVQASNGSTTCTATCTGVWCSDTKADGKTACNPGQPDDFNSTCSTGWVNVLCS